MFVANPKKPPQIEIILRRNKEKLLNFLKTFHNDKEGAPCSFLPISDPGYIIIIITHLWCTLFITIFWIPSSFVLQALTHGLFPRRWTIQWRKTVLDCTDSKFINGVYPSRRHSLIASRNLCHLCFFDTTFFQNTYSSWDPPPLLWFWLRRARYHPSRYVIALVHHKCIFYEIVQYFFSFPPWGALFCLRHEMINPNLSLASLFGLKFLKFKASSFSRRLDRRMWLQIIRGFLLYERQTFNWDPPLKGSGDRDRALEIQ